MDSKDLSALSIIRQDNNQYAGGVWFSETRQGLPMLRILLEGHFYTGYYEKPSILHNDAEEFQVVSFDADGVPCEEGKAILVRLKNECIKLVIKLNNGTTYCYNKDDVANAWLSFSAANFS